MTQETGWWEKILKGIDKVGFPVVVALILFGIFTGFIPSALTDVKDAFGLHVEALARTEKKIDDLTTVQTDQVKLLRLICRNTAKNDYQVSLCDK